MHQDFNTLRDQKPGTKQAIQIMPAAEPRDVAGRLVRSAPRGRSAVPETRDEPHEGRAEAVDYSPGFGINSFRLNRADFPS